MEWLICKGAELLHQQHGLANQNGRQGTTAGPLFKAATRAVSRTPDLRAADMIGLYLFLTPKLDSKRGGVGRLVTNASPEPRKAAAIGGRVPGPSGPGVFCEPREPRLRPTRGRPQPMQP